jgi:hypothetical protein
LTKQKSRDFCLNLAVMEIDGFELRIRVRREAIQSSSGSDSFVRAGFGHERSRKTKLITLTQSEIGLLCVVRALNIALGSADPM